MRNNRDLPGVFAWGTVMAALLIGALSGAAYANQHEGAAFFMAGVAIGMLATTLVSLLVGVYCG